jgi:hypothetical protein
MIRSWRGYNWRGLYQRLFHGVWLVLLIAVSLGERVMAAPPLTTIQDTLYLANGQPYTGFLIIEWKSFEASDASTVATQSITLRIYNGQLKTRLVPTTTATAGAHYRVKYVSEGKQQASEIWQVPPSAAALRVKDVRTGAPGNSAGGSAGGSTQVQIADVIGLTEALELRPVKGIGYTPGRAAIINGLGEIEAASGGDADCLSVAGLAGLCGDGSGAVFVDPVTPAGTMDGVNRVFTLVTAPNPAASTLLYRNGLLQRQGTDYTLANNTITFAVGAEPQAGDILLASYRMSGSGGSEAQVLCSAVGQSTSSASSTSLGLCVIPGELVRPGDRFEVKFDYTHSGTSSGFVIQVLWGGSVLVSRTASSSDSVVAGSGSVTYGPVSAQWNVQSWGNSLVFTAGTGSWASAWGDVTVDLLGSLVTAGTDSVSLGGYTIIRYPAP